MSKKQGAGMGGGTAVPTITEEQRTLGAVVAADPVAWLWVQQGPESGELEVLLPLVGEFTIGREGDVAIDRPTISRIHAAVVRLGQGLLVRLPALAPKNGIQVRAVRLGPHEEAAVDPGESWRLGTTVVVALTESQARGRRTLASLLGTDAATWAVDAAARGNSFGVVSDDAAARRAVALAIADISPRRTGRRGEILHQNGTHRPRDRGEVRAFADAVSSGLAIVEQGAMAALGLNGDDRGALERYLTDGVRAIQLIWCAESEGEARGRLGLVSDRLTWIPIPAVSARARAGALPTMFGHALTERQAKADVRDLLDNAGLRLPTLAGYAWPDGLAEFELCVSYLLDQFAGVTLQETAQRAGLSRFALHRLVQAWKGGERPRRRGLLDRMRRRSDG